ncbi:hypothetical protein [Flavobacterium sp.]|uniref:hypothetical protein n=1 Tax=Flavobacterium sp. TaxID=239 RepID=UPI00261DFD84|nr:hypothetical protein [Flavobacterium sp.]MDD2986380.1 hypothetical protein [Flavobacterium sp.]
MKRILLSLVLLIALSFQASAQEISKNALGLRLGSNDGIGAEISYQRGLSSNNRLELDLGIRNSDDDDAFKLVGLYQWVWTIENRFQWYAGVGGGVGTWDNNNKNKDYDDGSFLLLAGNIGIEYNFSIPLLLSLDYRPELYFGNNYRNDNFGSDIALSIRYQF